MSSPQIAEAEKRIQQAIESNATKLDLSGLALKSVPSDLVNLANLTMLDLSENQLTTVPSELGKLANLKKLCCTNIEKDTITLMSPLCEGSLRFSRHSYPA